MARTGIDSWRYEAAGAGRSRRAAAMPLIGEHMAPWLVAAFLLAVLNLVVLFSDIDPTTPEQVALVLGLCTTLAVAGLVAARSNRELAASEREERARPSRDQLVEGGYDASSPAYVDGMERWTAAMLELIDHAAGATDSGSMDDRRAQLSAAADDTRELRELLQASADGPLSINDTATLHALCSLWETNQVHIEELAAGVDPGWHRRWRARTIVQRRLRHGRRPHRPPVLPYR